MIVCAAPPPVELLINQTSTILPATKFAGEIAKFAVILARTIESVVKLIVSGEVPLTLTVLITPFDVRFPVIFKSPAKIAPEVFANALFALSNDAAILVF